MKKNKKNIIACSIVTIIIVIAITSVVIYNVTKNSNENEEKNSKKEKTETSDNSNSTVRMIKVEDEETVEDENIKVTLGKVATANEHIVIEYDVEIKVEDENLETKLGDQVSFTLPRRIIIGEKTLTTIDDVVESTQIAYKTDEGKLKVYDVIDINNEVINDSYGLDIQVKDPYVDNSDNYGDETSLLSQRIRKQLKKSETDENATTIATYETEDLDKITPIIYEAIETENGIFIKGTIALTNLTEKEYVTAMPPSFLDVNVLDQNGDTILDAKKSGKLTILDEDYYEVENSDFSIDKVETYRFEIEFLLGLFGDELENEQVKVQPYFSTPVNFYQYIDNKKTYSIDEQENIEENDNGGKVEVTKIQKEDDILTVYFTETGFIDNQSIIILKNDSSYKRPDKIERIEGNQYKAEFTLDNEYDKYIILEGTNPQLVGEGIDLNIQ